MDPSQPLPPPRGIGLGLILIGALVLGGLVALAVYTRQSTSVPEPANEQNSLEEDPRRTFDTPFLNVRPEVQYVGDAACLNCHREICDKFHIHPMGRSLNSIREEKAAASTLGSFSAENVRYDARFENGRLTHRERATKPDGSVLAERTAEIRYQIGSGGRGHSYLIEEGGRLAQSPISWYSSRQVLDLSPGYRERNAHFDRPIDANCLFCHANRVEPIDRTLNNYREPIFAGEAIGCERCHGPGELHVKQPGAAKGIDHTIVNPKHLEPILREAVCQQCHLQGRARVLRAGREVFDFRPGLPLELFYDTFVWHPGVPHDQKAVGHVEQMVESKCFEKSAGKFGCASCHDPHEKPSAAGSPNYFREQCLKCHTEMSCSVSVIERREKNRDECASCHMPKSSAVDVVHVSITDHRILRAPGRERPRAARPPRAGQPLLVPFHANSKYVPGDEAERDLALALVNLAGGTPPGPHRDYLARLAVPRLRDYAKLVHDPPASLALGGALRQSGDRAEALAVLDSVLERLPRYESALVEAGTAANELNRPADAVKYWKRAIEINPRRWHYHHQLAVALAEERDWSAALVESAEARRLNPFQIEVRLLEVGCLLDLGRKDDARKAFDDLLALKTPRADELRKWFEQQMKR